MKKGVIITAITTILVLQVVIGTAIIMMTQELMTIQQELNKTQGDLLDAKKENQMMINELKNSISETQESFESQMSKLKASTSADFSGIIAESIKGVVSISTDVSQGSGFFITNDGYVVTNAHVLDKARYARIITYHDQVIDTLLLGYNLTMDIAVLKVPDLDYDYLRLADSDEVVVGEKVIAMGNPLGLSFSVTEGIVSATKREGPNGMNIYIQTDVPLNPGNSGGPLIDKEGEVIGINNFKVGGSESLGFALESNEVKRAINEISMRVLNETIV